MKKAIYLILSFLLLPLSQAFSQHVLDFDGINDNITVPNASSYIANGPLSLSLWVYPTNSSPGWPDFDGIAGFRNEFSADFYLLHLNSTSVEARFRNSSGTNYDIVYSGINLNAWNHFVLTYDNSTLTLYHDGVNVSSRAAAGNITSTTQPLNIGFVPFQTNPFYLDGQLDDVALWNSSLSQAEVTTLYNACGMDTSAAGLVLCYEFNQGTAAGNNTGISSVIDSKGNANGSLNSFARTGSTSNFVGDTKGRSGFTTTLTLTECNSYISPSGKYLWTTTGQYQDTIANAAGCDSIFIVDLTISSSSSASIGLSACDSIVSPSGKYLWTASGAYVDTLTNAAGCDSFLVIKATVWNSSTTNVNETACDTYTSPSGTYTWNATGSYLDTLSSNKGCDSILNINLTIAPIDTSVTQVNNVELMANLSGASYQWIDCQSGTAISGATNQSFTATENGSYAVIVTDVCTDTSSCYEIMSVGVVEQVSFPISLYPNPAEGMVKIDLARSYAFIHLSLTNVLGEVVLERAEVNLAAVDLDISELPVGIYTLSIQADQLNKSMKLVKK